MSRGIRKYSIVLRQRERVRRDDADVRLDVDERLRIEVLRVDHRVEDVGEHLELVADADVVAVRRDAVRDHAGADLLVHERLDHPVLARHALDPRSDLIAMPSMPLPAEPAPESASAMILRMMDVVEREIEGEVAAPDVDVAGQPSDRHADHHQQADGRDAEPEERPASCP